MATEQHRWIIDSIEEFVAAVEVDHDSIAHVPQWLLPKAAAEGDVLSVVHERSDDGERSTLRVAIDRDATRRMKEASARQVSGGKSPKDPGGAIKL